MAQASIKGGGGNITFGTYGIGGGHSVIYFPESVNYKRAVNIAEIPIPGLNHPCSQYVSVGAGKISVEFLLYGYDVNPPMPIYNEINTLKTWTLTTMGPTFSMPGEMPPILNVLFHGVAMGLQMYVTDLEINVTMYDDNLSPVEAEVHLELTEYVPVLVGGGGSLGSLGQAPAPKGGGGKGGSPANQGEPALGEKNPQAPRTGGGIKPGGSGGNSITKRIAEGLPILGPGIKGFNFARGLFKKDGG